MMEQADKKTLSDNVNHNKGIWHTMNIPLFGEIPSDVQKSITEHSVQTTKRKGSYLFRAGDEVDSVIIIKKGRIKLCKNDADGNEYILDIIHDGDAIWENLFFKDAVFSYSAVCLSKADVWAISKSKFMEFIADFPSIAMNLISMLSLRLKDSNEKVMLLSIRDPKVRLAGFLLDRDIRCVGPEIKLKLEDIAASIGLRPETVSRNLSLFEKNSLIKRLGKGRILVTDRKGLKEIYELVEPENENFSDYQ